MFNKDFYPTPKNIIDIMLQGVEIQGKTFLEPSAGKGDIVKYLNSHGARKVLAVEINPDLRKVLSGDAQVIGDDFLQIKAEDISHVHYIVMNPPFSADEKHITHAYEIAPEGCEIIALCNSETLRRTYFQDRKRLAYLIENYGNTEELGNCFSTAERPTNVEVSLVHLYKPMISSEMNMEGFYLEEQDIQDSNGIIIHSDMRNLVESYVKSVKCFDELEAVSKKMREYTQMSGFGRFGEGCGFMVGHSDVIISKEEFASSMQKYCWKRALDMLNLDKYLTSGVQNDINKFVEQQQRIPFTLKNIYRMAEILVGTSKQIMDRAIIEVVDNFTKYTNENRYGLEGWKTNAGHLLNQKFIVADLVEVGNPWRNGFEMSYLRLSYHPHKHMIDDLIKVLCYLTGERYNDLIDEEGNVIEKGHPSLRDVFNKNTIFSNTWYDFGLLRFKAYKKGTMHLKFKDNKTWEKLNRAYAEAKGQTLPEKI